MPKVRGRPPQGSEAKRHSISLRVTPQVMEKLDAAIAANGKSLAQELEQRVERTFEEEGRNDTATSILLGLIPLVIAMVEARTGKKWNQDPEAFHAFKELLAELIDRHFTPLMPPELVKLWLEVKDDEDVPVTNGIGQFLGQKVPSPGRQRFHEAYRAWYKKDEGKAVAASIAQDIRDRQNGPGS